MIELLFVDGTWSRPGARSPVAEALRKALDPTKVKFTYVDYPADFGPATGAGDVSYADSVMAGVVALSDAVERSEYDVVVSGYSQGAAVAVHYVLKVLPRKPHHIVRALATLGDPHQPRHGGRSGIAGPITLTIRSFRRYVPGDPIADLDDGSPVRTVADLSRWMSVRSLEAARAWAYKTAAELPKAQRWWAPWNWVAIGRAGEAIRNYLGTAHSTDYIGQGHVNRLARDIEGVA